MRWRFRLYTYNLPLAVGLEPPRALIPPPQAVGQPERFSSEGPRMLPRDVSGTIRESFGNHSRTIRESFCFFPVSLLPFLPTGDGM